MSQGNFERENGSFEFIAMIFLIFSSIAIWAGSGWLLWHWLDVNSFLRGMIWLVLWGVVGGIAQLVIPSVIMVVVTAICSIFTKKL